MPPPLLKKQNNTPLCYFINVTPGHHYGEGAPLKQINTRACGKYCQTKSCIEQAPEMSQDDSQWQNTEDKVMTDCSYQDWKLEGVSEAGNLLEELLGKVIAFSELKENLRGTVPLNYHNLWLLCCTAPPDRAQE